MREAPWSSSLFPRDDQQRSQSNSMEAALAYTGLSWNARSHRVTSRRTMRCGGCSPRPFAQTLIASYRPYQHPDPRADIQLRMETQSWSAPRSRTPMASVSLLYKQSHRLLVSAMGGYTSTKSSDGLIGTESIVGRGCLRI